MGFYPPEIDEHFAAPKHAGKAARTNAAGTGVSFLCGSFLRFYLDIEPQTKIIRDARYKTNGCGYAIAAAEVLAEKVVGRKLTELHGLNHGEMLGAIECEFSASRAHCAEVCFDALQAAFQDFRARQIEEFAGERALICTCFGVSEDTIQKIIAEQDAATLEEVGDICHAGTGCGSCRFLIQELIDVREFEN